MAGGEQSYSEEEAQEILRRAARQDLHGGALSREALLKTAAELGISKEAVERAALEVRRERGTKEELEEFRGHQRRRFMGHFVSFVLVNLFLLAINLITSPGHLWFLYPFLGWGLGLGFHANGAFNEGSDDWQRELATWRRRRAKSKPDTTFEQPSVREVLEQEIAAAVELGSPVSRLELVRAVRQQAGLTASDSTRAVEQYLLDHPGAPVA